MAFYVLGYYSLNLNVPQVIAHLTERVVFFLYPSSFPIHSIFVVNNFHKQLSVKNS